MRSLRGLYLFVFFLVCLLFIVVVPAQAGTLKFDKGTVTVNPGDTFMLGAMVDAGSDQITSTDMWIVYDAMLLEAQTASASSYFPAVTSNISSGKVYIAGLVTDPGTYEVNSGTVAYITFKALKNGSATISYDCRTDVSNSSKIIKNSVDATNVISCTGNGTSIVTIGTGIGGATVVPTRIPIATAYYNQQAQPTALPQTGYMDILPRMGVIGAILLGTGLLLRILLVL